MNDKRAEIIEKIYEIYKSRGFVKEAEILDFADEANLSIFDTNRLTEHLLGRGVIIRNDAPQRPAAGEDEYDASKIDYNALFNRVVAENPELKTFIKYIRKIQPPQRNEWVGLVPQAKSGNKWAYNRLIEMNLRVVVKSALYFSDTYQIALADALQDGFLGLLYAIEKFDPSEHNSFPGYITRPITAYIQRNADFSPSPLFYFPSLYQEELYKIFALVDNHQCQQCFCGDKTDCDFLIAEVAEKLECSYVDAMKHLGFFAEYDRMIYNLVDENSESQFDMAVQTELQRIVREVLAELDPKEEAILRMRIGFECQDDKIRESFENSPYKSFEQRSFSGMSLEEVGDIYGLTRERVRQIEQKALNKLKHPTRARKLRAFLDEYPITSETPPPIQEAISLKFVESKVRTKSDLKVPKEKKERPPKPVFIVQQDMMSKGWKATALKRLKALHDKGLSASVIAEKLGKTKNAVIGKLNRLGWN